MSKYPYILNKKINTEPDVTILDEMNINVTELPPIASHNSQKRLN